MKKLFAHSALLLTTYSAATLMGCGGSTETVAADANGGGGSSDTGNNSRPGASSSGSPGVAGGPSEPSNNSEAGSDSSIGISTSAGVGTTSTGTTSGEAGADSGIGTGGNPGAPIKCGPELTCDGATEYCVESTDDSGCHNAFSCAPLPSECLATPTCACFASHNIGMGPPAWYCSCTDTDGLLARACSADCAM